MNQSTSAPKLPPQNMEAEASLLGSLLLDSDAIINVADIVNSADFYDERHRLIFDAILHLYEKHRPIDVLTVTNRLTEEKQLENAGGAALVSELVSLVPSAAHAVHYAEIVHKKGTLRRLIQASQDIINLGYDEDSEVEETLAQAEQRLFAVSQATIGQDIMPIEAILEQSFERLDDLHRDKGRLRGIPTGFTDMDNKLAGMQKSDLLILAARPSMGKTTLALNIAHHVATKDKLPVLIFSLEMSKEQLVDRLLSAESGIDAWNLRTGNISDKDFEQLNLAYGELSEAPIYIDDTPGITALEMRTKARREQHKHALGLVVVDYLQLMSGASRSYGDNRVQEISEISRGLKALARELNVPVLALSQLSRSVEQRSPKIPQLQDLRESGSIEQDADVVMFIYREDYYEPDTERKHISDIFISKHRNGPTGKIELFFHPEQLAFRSIDRKHGG
jgi:replicative DNA helicase